MTDAASAALRLTIDSDALAANWRWLRDRAGVACGAAVKADGYGLGARHVVDRLAREGCRDIFVSSWWEAAALGPLPDGVSLSVLHGVRMEDLGFALAAAPAVRPVLNSAEQVARWKAAGGGACDVMIDSGINRLGLRPEETDCLDGLAIDTLMSHLASADEEGNPFSDIQRRVFAEVAGRVPARRRSLANSAGICLGHDYAFDLVRPGIALYGGIPRGEAAGHIRPVARIEAQVIQVRDVAAGETVGYGRLWLAERPSSIAVLNIGYADGYLRGFSNAGRVTAGAGWLPVVGRVSMDMIGIDVTGADVAEGDWLALDPDLAEASRVSGLSQYELLTGLGHRYQRRWT